MAKCKDNAKLPERLNAEDEYKTRNEKTSTAEDDSKGQIKKTSTAEDDSKGQIKKTSTAEILNVADDSKAQTVETSTGERLNVAYDSKTRTEKTATTERLNEADDSKTRTENKATPDRLNEADNSKTRTGKTATIERFIVAGDSKTRTENKATPDRLNEADDSKTRTEKTSTAERLNVADDSKTRTEKIATTEKFNLADDSKTRTEKTATEMDFNNSKRFLKWINTVFLMLTWICQGIYMEAGGPTLKDMILKLDSNYEDISNAISARGIGVFVGTLFTGFAVDRFPKYNNLLIALCLTVAAVVASCVPWVPNVQVLWAAYLILGATQTALNLAGQRQILLIWGDKAASPMNFAHLGYAVGAFAAPLVANPFLATFVDKGTLTNSSNATESVANTTDKIPESNQHQNSESQIEYAYMIIGIFTLIISVIFYVLQFISLRSKRYNNTLLNRKDDENDDISTKKTLKDMFNPASCGNGNICLGITTLSLLFLRYAWLVGWDRTFGTFLRSYAIDQLAFSKDEASYLNTVFWACYAGGRFAGFIIARFIPVKYLLLANSVLCTLISMLLLIFGREYSIGLWVLTVSMGFSLGPLYPTGVAWGDSVIEMTGLAISILLFGASFGELAFIKVDGIMYSDHGPTSFVYIIFLIGILLTITDILLIITSVMKRRLFKVCGPEEASTEPE